MGKASLLAERGKASIATEGTRARNIVVFSDGTGQEGGVRPEQRLSNVYKLYRACRLGPDNDIDPAKQIAFYDPGLGTDTSATGLTSIKRRITKLLSSVTGRGITVNISDCYEFIINHYRPGDRIYLFGFSRGAYTIRCLANVLWLCGIPTKIPDGELPRFRTRIRDIANEGVLRVYEHGAGWLRAEFEDERMELARRFRERYGSDDAGVSNAAPYFIGAFDTVASLGAKGWLRIGLTLLLALAVGGIVIASSLGMYFGLGLPWAPSIGLSAVIVISYAMWRFLKTALKFIRRPPQGGRLSWHIAQWNGKNFDRLLTKSVAFARHAISIDESRADFPRLKWGWGGGYRPQVKGGDLEPLVQMWFAGNHSDIGGSYPEAESRLSDVALSWMVEEATSVPAPLLVDRTKLHLHPSAGGLQHDEIAGMTDTIRGRTPALFRWLTQGWTWKVEPRAPPVASPTVHPSVAERFALAQVDQQGQARPYRPDALRRHDMFKQYYSSGQEG